MYYWRKEANYWQTQSIARPLCDSRASCFSDVFAARTDCRVFRASPHFFHKNFAQYFGTQGSMSDCVSVRIVVSVCWSVRQNGLIYCGCSGLVVEYRTRNREVAGSTHTRSTASNLEQVANLVCAQANSASYLQRNGKWVVSTATGWMPSVADWSDGVSASCTVGPIVR